VPGADARGKKRWYEQLSDYLIGYVTTAEPDVRRTGPQPVEAVVAEVCAAFGCTPSQALREEWTLVSRVLEYRNAREALRLFNGGPTGLAQLQQQPQLVALLLAMTRAANGDDTLTESALLASAPDRPDTPEGEGSVA
jgi:hypothetical protein